MRVDVAPSCIYSLDATTDYSQAPALCDVLFCHALCYVWRSSCGVVLNDFKLFLFKFHVKTVAVGGEGGQPTMLLYLVI